jgi:hypothetical protein
LTFLATGDTWWRVDVVAVDDATDPEALFDLEFTFTGDSPGLKARLRGLCGGRPMDKC